MVFDRTKTKSLESLKNWAPKVYGCIQAAYLSGKRTELLSNV